MRGKLHIYDLKIIDTSKSKRYVLGTYDANGYTRYCIFDKYEDHPFANSSYSDTIMYFWNDRYKNK